MNIKDVINVIEEIAPLAYAEDFDNVGLLVGNHDTKVTNVLVTLDTLESIVDEAIEKDCNLIISFHPIVFSGLKRFNGNNYVEKVVMKAIKNDIAIYAMHTALDNSINGVNDRICQQLGLENRKILIPKKGVIKKLTTYVPTKDLDEVRTALFKAGAGNIGNYDECSFTVEGTGTFKGNDESKPVIGQKGITHFEAETQLGVTFPKHIEGQVINALLKAHPYEEVAYEVVSLDNTYQHLGMGMIGELPVAMPEKAFLELLKQKMNVSVIKHSVLLGKPIKNVAVLGGSGSFAIENAKRAGADVFVTADMKYHQFYQAEGQLVIADIGHYESEQFTKNLLVEHLSKKIHNFAIILSEVNTNPIKYS
ncbi:Nif3-like dinuclear metal center hexameric protein [Sungkyunkwania multivorans]|uniref:GTP cyclohydrolase 1 type 2 homolog n=1 Tax=Sungkyunkwania multivorans TaxID=1173618 RepID=A0ABW3D0N4_9FLAO